MATHHGPVLLDTNVILECHHVAAWRALAAGYSLETVEDCVAETQTGYERRPSEQQIDPTRLQASLAAIHSVEDLERAELLVQASGIAVDRGEESLWAHALTRNDGWKFCGPDIVSFRFGATVIKLHAPWTLSIPGNSKLPKAPALPAYRHSLRIMNMVVSYLIRGTIGYVPKASPR